MSQEEKSDKKQAAENFAEMFRAFGQAVSEIFSDPETAGNIPSTTLSETKNCYMIKDIWECRAELEADIGFPVTLWFPKNLPTDKRPNRILLDFGGRILSVQDKKAVESAINNLFIGWA